MGSFWFLICYPSDPLAFYFWRTWNAQIRPDYCTRVVVPVHYSTLYIEDAFENRSIPGCHISIVASLISTIRLFSIATVAIIVTGVITGTPLLPAYSVASLQDQFCRCSSRSSVSEEHLMGSSMSLCRIFPTWVAACMTGDHCRAAVGTKGSHCWNTLLRNNGNLCHCSNTLLIINTSDRIIARMT
jgi:hypothetical protein